MPRVPPLINTRLIIILPIIFRALAGLWNQPPALPDFYRYYTISFPEMQPLPTVSCPHSWNLRVNVKRYVRRLPAAEWRLL